MREKETFSVCVWVKLLVLMKESLALPLGPHTAAHTRVTDLMLFVHRFWDPILKLAYVSNTYPFFATTALLLSLSHSVT